MAVVSEVQVPNGRQHSLYTRSEVAQHKRKGDAWIIIHGKVYNVTNWLARHPGGAKVLLHYAGQDATVAFESFHNNKEFVSKYMSTYLIGQLISEDIELPAVSKDFLQLKKDLEDKGLFKVNPCYFVLLFLHIVAMELAACFVLWQFGNSWSTWLVATVLLCASQAQAGWLQHDFGHRSVFQSTFLNSLFHDISIGCMKGVSSYWWNYRHYQHHAKPNVYLKDPDITIPYLFLLGKIIPAKWGKRRWGKLPYHLQHVYFFFTFPPLLLPIYFHLEVVFYSITHKKLKDILLMLFFYIRWHLLLSPLLGGFWASFRLYFFVRFLESHWFAWSTQISHLPMPIDLEKHKDWVSMQLAGTCNTHSSPFADWFLGHLNFQIEHHLFPTMPRHNFVKAQPYVREFCASHGIHYELKSNWKAFADIYYSLKESGEVWLEAWDMTMPSKTD